MKRLLLAAAAAALHVAAHSAPALTGNDYLEMQQSNPFANAMYVQAYMDASLTVNGLAQQNGAAGDRFKQLTICAPEGAKRGQAVDIVTKFIVDNPDIRERPLNLLTGTALLMVWSCG